MLVLDLISHDRKHPLFSNRCMVCALCDLKPLFELSDKYMIDMSGSNRFGTWPINVHHKNLANLFLLLHISLHRFALFS